MRREPQETFITLKDALIFKKKEKKLLDNLFLKKFESVKNQNLYQ